MRDPLPVARVAVDVPLPHLDRPFDYEVPEAMAETAVPGTRVRVRFAGRLVDGWVLERATGSEHPGRLSRLSKVVSADPVLAPEIARLARAVADRYAGTLADVLRLAVPPRHARAEAGVAPEAPTPGEELPLAAGPGPWAAYRNGPAFLRAVAGALPARAVWSAAPGPGAAVADALAGAVAAARTAGRGALLVVPDARDVARLAPALDAVVGPGGHVQLTADLGPAERYRRFLAVRRGHVRVVLGTRAAAFAPVRDLGLAVVWDDGDDLHAEPHAPYPHVREILALRSELEGCALLVGGYAVTAEGQQLNVSGWAHPIVAQDHRRDAPRVRAAGGDAELARDEAARSARLPALAWRTAHDALRSGPVLVQVPRRGYLPTLACARCREPARCAHCGGPLTLTSGHAIAQCRWCARPAGGWRCPECGGDRFRAQVVGAVRTAEELGRAFPGVPVITSGRDGVRATVPADPALVVATPGAEPVADTGYAAALLLDGWALLERADLRAGEEALRRWLNAAALVRPAGAGGLVVVLADSARRPVQALLRWDPWWAAARELDDREAVRFPPAARLAEVTGSPAATEELLEAAHLPDSAEVLGPQALEAGEGEQRVRLLIRTPRHDGLALASALHAAQGVRSARKAAETSGPVRVRIDPADLA
ncbi:MAG TPA: primosomal protein N' [Actinomycetes bacterium]|nr:primosomal protein N' [Actinomycetes bacterium]